jgi:hypothetical protein
MYHSDIQRRFHSLSPFLDERMRRLMAAAESEALGYGGITAVAHATGVSRRAITEGMKELSQRERSRKALPASSRIRRQGAGRKRTADKDAALLEDLVPGGNEGASMQTGMSNLNTSTAADQSRSHHQSYCRHDIEDGLGGEKRPRLEHLSGGDQDFRSTDGGTPAQESYIPWRLELQPPAPKLTH